MTILEMHYDFDFKFDKVASQAKPDFSVSEKDWVLNEAQWMLTKMIYSDKPPKVEGFEGNQKRISDLDSIVIKFPYQPDVTPTNLGGIYEVPLASLVEDYWLMVRARAEIEDALGCSS
jgi:hypothetical protein